MWKSCCYFHITETFGILAVKCPEAPYVKETETNGPSNLDLVSDPPSYLDVAQYTCNEGYVFEVYDPLPDENGTYYLMEDVSTINLTCADNANWMPEEVPKCIRKLEKQSGLCWHLILITLL